MRTWTTLTTWAVAAAVLVAAVKPTQAQARERRPLYRPRMEVAAVAEAEPSVADGSDSINTLHTITSSQLSSNDSYRGSGDGSNSTTNADSYEVSRPSPGNENVGAGVTGRQHGGGNRQHGGGRRQGGGGGGRQQGGGGGGRQQGGGGGGRQQGGGGGRQQGGGGGGGRQHEETYSNVATGDRISSGSLPESDISRHQMDTTILLLQRLSDRLTATETLQNQRAERIDTINYRLTRIELQAEERKSVISELSNSLRHRMETTDNELDTIVTHLDEIKSSIRSLGQQHNEFKATISEIPKEQGAESGQSLGLKLQAVTATINGLRSAMQAVKDDISQIGQNLTVLTNVSQNLSQLSQNIVTKQYMHQSLNEIRNKDASPSMSLLAHMMGQSRAPRRGSGNQGKVSTEPEDCWKLMNQGKNKSGVYRIRPSYATAPFFVYCDMETDGGGWTVIQRREDGSVDFLREWADYKYGFGNLAGEFWLGNEKIHLLTNQHVSKLRVELADFDQQSGHAVYSAFAIGSELEGYSLKMLGQYSGDAGDSLRYHVGRRFSTTDVDNDAWPEKSCARDHKGAWWYRACETSNLNGRYLHGPVPADHQYTGLYWYDFRGPQYSLWKSSMMIRRGGNVGDPVFKAFKEVKKQATTERISSNNQQDKITTSSPDNFNPDHDPYAIYEYPTYS